MNSAAMSHATTTSLRHGEFGTLYHDNGGQNMESLAKDGEFTKGVTLTSTKRNDGTG